jgi:hypothetical protein
LIQRPRDFSLHDNVMAASPHSARDGGRGKSLVYIDKSHAFDKARGA